MPVLPFLEKERRSLRSIISHNCIVGQNNETATAMNLLLNLGASFLLSGPEKGVITKGVFSPEESLESLRSLSSLESLENGRIDSFVFHNLGVL